MKLPQDTDYYGRDELSLESLINVFKELDVSDSASGSLEAEPEKVNNQTAEDSEITPSNSTDSSSSNEPTQPRTLKTLPPEIQLKIFDLLCPVNSTCLGLACKKFYEIHQKYHGKVSLMIDTRDMSYSQRANYYRGF